MYIDYTLANPDNLTKWKTAAAISEKVLAAVSQLCVAGEKIITICQKGDKIIEEEVAKVYRTTKHKGRLPPFHTWNMYMVKLLAEAGHPS